MTNKTIDLSTVDFAQTTAAVSITQAAVNLLLVGGKLDSGDLDLGVYQTRGLISGLSLSLLLGRD